MDYQDLHNQACGILIIEVQVEMNLIEVGISDFNVNVD